MFFVLSDTPASGCPPVPLDSLPHARPIGFMARFLSSVSVTSPICSIKLHSEFLYVKCVLTSSLPLPSLYRYGHFPLHVYRLLIPYSPLPVFTVLVNKELIDSQILRSPTKTKCCCSCISKKK
jgi:hypothetical protein